MRVVVQADQWVFRVVEDTLLDLKGGPGGPTYGWLSWGAILHWETGADVTYGDCLDGPCEGEIDILKND